MSALQALPAVQALLDAARSEAASPERIAALEDALAAIRDAAGRRDNTRRKQLNDESIGRAQNRWKHWTSRELDVLARRDLTNRQVADLLRRSVSGVRLKRQKLNGGVEWDDAASVSRGTVTG